QRLAVRSNRNRAWLPFWLPKLFVSASVFAAKLCGKLCDSRPRFLATPSRPAGDVQRRRQARNALQPFYCRDLAAYRMKGLSALSGRTRCGAPATTLPTNALAPPVACPPRAGGRGSRRRPPGGGGL